MYASALTLDLRKRSIQESDPISKEQGIKVGVTVKKNHCVPDRNPYLKTEYFAIFGQGIEQYLETLENAIQQGIITKAGAWIKDPDPTTNEPNTYNGEKLYWQGKEAFRNFCIDNPSYFEELKSRIKGIAIQMTAEEVSTIQEEEKQIEDTLDEDIIEAAKEPKKGKKK